MENLGSLRREYISHELDEKNIVTDPFDQFFNWLSEAINSKEADATAMVLSTVNEQHRPSSRIVLLKHFDNRGFDFFTNYNGKKSKHLEQNPYASLLFYWGTLNRQVRIEGKIEKISTLESDTYFASRPEQSKIAAWASPQSSVIPNRKTLKDWYEEMDDIMRNTEIKRPPHWGGFRLVPDLFEFWQGRESRLHDRIEFILDNKAWKIRRLAP
jgi:pyridoxamine 5'-phosphate oxidase